MPFAAYVLVLMQPAGSTGSGSPTIEEMMDRARPLLPQTRCQSSAEEGIVVCGSPSQSERYRLPLRDERTSLSHYDRVRGDVPRASIETSAAPCGIFEGQRRCGRAEAAEFGYGNGRDPLSVAAGVFQSLAKPD